MTDWVSRHIELYRIDPERAHMWDSSFLGGPGVLATLLLTTTGRRSGAARSIPLIYGEDGESFVVVASKGGAPRHPSWFLNLQVYPDCKLLVGPRKVSARARVAAGEERERLWRQMTRLYPPYVEYQRKAKGRKIPVVVLDPLS